MTNKLNVYLHHIRVGVLERTDKGYMRFTYDMENPELLPVSVNMPLRAAPYEDPECRSLFGGLLTENRVRERLAKLLHVSPQNDFAFLERFGIDCAGAISLWPEGETPHHLQPIPLDQLSGTPLDDQAFDTLIKELMTAPENVLQRTRMSLAGAQNKIALLYKDNQFHIPDEGVPTDVILKPPIPDLPDTVYNEYFCMCLAKKLIQHMLTPISHHFIYKTFSGIPVFVTHRYDRYIAVDHTTQTSCRFHQEDACQVLGLAPDMKYQNEGGPSIENLFSLVGHETIVDKNTLLQMICFNFVIGNYDAHGKNFSFLHMYTPKGANVFRKLKNPPSYTKAAIYLAPPYDILCAEVYVGQSNIERKMAMSISAGKYDPRMITRRDWERLAEECDLGGPYVIQTLKETAQKMLAEGEKLQKALVDEGNPSPIYNAILDVIRRTADDIQAHY